MNITEQTVKHVSLLSLTGLAAADHITGTIFKKQIMSYGDWINPNWWWDDEIFMELTEEMADEMIANFEAKTFGKRVSVPRNHTGDVNENAGEVVKLEKGPGGLWAYLDIRDAETVQKIDDGLIFDVSMGFDWDYVDQKTGKHHGVVLIHVALVTDPYLNDMDDFRKTTIDELSRRFTTYAKNVGFGTESKSIIMMSKSKVEEMKRMKFAKVANDKEYVVEVKYKGEDGNEVVTSVEPGAEVEVPTEVADEVTNQIANSTAPTSESTETDEERQAREDQEAADAKAKEDAEAAEAEAKAKKDAEDKEQDSELSRVLAENAALKAEKTYDQLLAKGKITPAQKDLFLSLATTAPVKLSKAVTLSKDQTLKEGESASVISLLSAILSAGPSVLKLGEKGSDKTDATEGEVTLTDEDRAMLSKLGVSEESYIKQVKDGTFSKSKNKE